MFDLYFRMPMGYLEVALLFFS